MQALPDAHPGANDYLRSRAKFVIRLKDGRIVEHEIPDFRGTRSNPMTVDDDLDKFRGNVGDSSPPRPSTRWS